MTFLDRMNLLLWRDRFAYPLVFLCQQMMVRWLEGAWHFWSCALLSVWFHLTLTGVAATFASQKYFDRLQKQQGEEWT